MGRYYNFNQKTKDGAFFRQWNRCAHCGIDLIFVEDHAHHVVPNQTGNPNSLSDNWLMEVDNCVILCEKCHWRVHENGKYKDGATPDPEFYPYSHGKEKKLHFEWVRRLHQKFK